MKNYYSCNFSRYCILKCWIIKVQSVTEIGQTLQKLFRVVNFTPLHYLMPQVGLKRKYFYPSNLNNQKYF